MCAVMLLPICGGEWGGGGRVQKKDFMLRKLMSIGALGEQVVVSNVTSLKLENADM